MATGTAEVSAQQSMDNYNNARQDWQPEKVFGDFYGMGIKDAGVVVDARPDQNEFMVTISYKIVGYDQVFTVDHILTPTR